MTLKKTARVLLSLLSVLAVVVFLVAPALNSHAVHAQSGVLDLRRWDAQRAFAIAGEWRCYSGLLLSPAQTKSGQNASSFVYLPATWSGDGANTYCVQIDGASEGARYGLRIQGQTGAYRFFVQDELIAVCGDLADTASAPCGEYRPQTVSFAAPSQSFTLTLQVQNNIYPFSGATEPVLFGTEQQLAEAESLLMWLTAVSVAGVALAVAYFLAFFAGKGAERSFLAMCALCFTAVLRLLIIGDAALSGLFPALSLEWLTKLDFLSMLFAQLFLALFLRAAYATCMPRFAVAALLCYALVVALLVAVLPLATFVTFYTWLNVVLLVVLVLCACVLARAAWRAEEGSPVLFFAVLMLLAMVLYKLFVPDGALFVYLAKITASEYLVVVFVQMGVMAKRYRSAQALEIAYLRGQIRPHFINNALTAIISVSREDPEKARGLLADFSVYLRGFYENDRLESVPLSRELELVSAYAALEQARFGEKLRISYCIEKENVLLPPLTLQPLVENAFVHGLRPKKEGGTVTVYARSEKKGWMRIGVRDDGVGCEPGKLVRGVALENIDRRLRKLYKTSLVFATAQGGGCEVYFEIPSRKKERKMGKERQHEGLAH